MEKAPITRLGYERLYWQLQYLRRFARREVAEDLADARAYGVSINNLQWRTARERQLWVETAIQDLEFKIANSEIRLVPLKSSGRVDFGLFIKVIDDASRQAAVYQMVGPYESDVGAGKLSVDSPVGRMLMHRSVGEWVTIYCPNGVRRYQILEVFQLGDGSLLPALVEEPE